MNVSPCSEPKKEVSKQQQFEILREEVCKGFQQLFNGQTSDNSALDIFAEVSKEIDGKLQGPY